MKTVGICIPTIEGGVVCHQEIGREAARRGIAYPQIATHTPLFAPLKWSLDNDDFGPWIPTAIDSVNRTAKAGADIAIISANTVHVIFDQIAAGAVIPIISIVDAVGDYCMKNGYKRVGILGTTITIQKRIYDGPLAKRGIETAYPPLEDQDKMMEIIQSELIKGLFLKESTELLEDIVRRLGATCDAIILGCTELPLVLFEESCKVKLVDTTRVLAHAALDAAILGV